MEEIWKELPDTNGKYECSSFGRVRIKDTKYLVSFSTSSWGYHKCAINRKSIKVHRLIAKTFLPKIEGKDEVNHIDFDRKNNKIDNLEWTSRRENHTHAVLRNGNNSGSKYIGVTKQSKKYLASVHVNKIKVRIGLFENELDARDAYLNYLKDHNIENKYAHL